MSSKSKNFIGALFILLVLALGAYVFWHNNTGNACNMPLCGSAE
jgi:hypothetical protein